MSSLSLHRPCGGLVGPTPYGDQGCPCAPTPRWPGCDVSEVARLCTVCARGTAGGETRWAWLGCDYCCSLEHRLRRRLGIVVLPLGRHSLKNSVGLRLDTPADDPAVAAFTVQMEALSRGWDALANWYDAEVRRLAGAFDGEFVPLAEWRRRWPASAQASRDAYERFLGVPVAHLA